MRKRKQDRKTRNKRGIKQMMKGNRKKDKNKVDDVRNGMNRRIGKKQR